MRSDFESLLSSPDAPQVLKLNSTDKSSVRQLQQALYEAGFGTELKWTTAGADGEYGSDTAKAVQAFASKNGISTDGMALTPQLGAALAKTTEIAVHLKPIQDAIDLNEVETTLFDGSDDSAAIEGLQHVLHRLGYDKELKWERFGADGDYGGSTTNAVLAFAAKEGLSSDGKKLSRQLAERMIAKFKPSLGDTWSQLDSTAHARIARPAEIRNASNGRGVYDAGRLSAKDFIEKNPSLLSEIGMTVSTLNVISAVSQNEGKLEAINTYDNSFMTFGMFQWTIGAKSGKGELAALLKKIKEQDDDVFFKYFGQYGLDVHNKKTNSTYGYLTLNGRLLNKARKKERLRTTEWAIRFWKAGHDPLVQAVEIEHAANRLKTFYWKDKFKANGFLLSELVTSEYGVALLLDNHVNRPGFVKKCIAKAMNQTGLSNPSGWTTQQEQDLLKAYLKIRETYQWTDPKVGPMTHAKKRGDLVTGLMKAGKMSGERGSFAFGEEIGSRSIFDNEPLPPANYDDEAYDIIEGSDVEGQE
ncbi:MAG: peptidoglycan-binding protein [Bacteroidota bacterium]